MSLNGTEPLDSLLSKRLQLGGNGAVLGEVKCREPGCHEIGQMGFPDLSVLNDADRAFEQDGAGPWPDGELGRALGFG